MKRLFSKSEKRWLYFVAEGKCQICGKPLGEDWEADHIVPYSKGGATDTTNGQAVCQSCNRRKGAHMPYNIPKGLRTPQAESLEVTQQKIADDDRFQLNLLAPGTGKSLLALATADYLFGHANIKRVIFVTIRTNLLTQIAEDDDLYRNVYDGHPQHVRLVQERGDKKNLFNAGEYGVVAAVTYNYVLNNFDTLLKFYTDSETAWILDEADRLGQATRYDVDGTPVNALQASEAIRKIYRKRPGFILMTTGWPYRHDGKPLILCDDLGYYDELEDGSSILTADVSCSLTRSIKLRYLRPLDLQFVDGDYKEHDMATGAITKDRLSNREHRLASILKRPDTWQTLAMGVLGSLDLQRNMFGSNMKALITAVDNDHAADICDFIQRDGRYIPVISTSMTDPDNTTLHNFRDNMHGDILITVQKASIGFDNKNVSVIGLLWNIRSEAANRQAVGRGMRWKSDLGDEQYCIVIYPKDKAMNEIMENINRDNEQGKVEREQTIDPPPDGPGTGGGPAIPLQDAMSYIVGVQMDTHFQLNGTDVQTPVEGDDAEFFKAACAQLNMRPSKGLALQQMWEKYKGGDVPPPEQSEPDAFDELCNIYNCKRRHLLETISDRLRGNIGSMRPRSADLGAWYQSAYAVAKRYNQGMPIKDIVDPLRYHELFVKIKENQLAFRSEVFTMYDHIMNKGKPF